ncbi:MAG TPA: MetS family NSS transporter small subunit [Calditrichia bacterium]|nr:MetS family NSS transporter small subunit [Calditrichia bacterium]HQV33469.1 MetS family NSS transporter small subunit [Calditrichia bacterium]
MPISTIITMVVILGFIWGGTAYFLYRAFQRENKDIKS